MVRLTLSSESVRNTVITNEQGQVVYKTVTPFQLGVRTTTIQKIKPNDGQYHMHDQFDVLGKIEWHTFVSSKFRFGETEVETKEFIPRRGILGRMRVFIGPDSRPYRWHLKTRVVVVSTGTMRLEWRSLAFIERLSESLEGNVKPCWKYHLKWLT
jgi:hypothetical protein